MKNHPAGRRLVEALARGAVAAAAAWLAAGCATLPEGAPLTKRQMTRLQARVRTPEDLGIDWEMTRKGLRATNSRTVPAEAAIRVPLNVQPFADASLPIIRVRINGALVLALIDSGSSISLIEYGAAMRAGVVPLGPSLIRLKSSGLGGPTEQFLGVAQTLTVEGVDIGNVPIGILNLARGMESLAWLEGYRVEAVLGSDFLRAFRMWALDLGGESLELSAKGGYQPNEDKLLASAPLAAAAGIPTVEAWLGGRGPVNLALDTGGRFGVWVPRGIGNKLKLPELEDNQPPARGYGFGGLTLYRQTGPYAIRLSRFTLGDIGLTLGLLNLGENEPGHVLLGTDVLRKYRFIVDYDAGSVFFERP